MDTRVAVALEDERILLPPRCRRHIPPESDDPEYQSRQGGIRGLNDNNAADKALCTKKETPLNKAVEFWRRVQLERLMTKSRILELYLNRRRSDPTSGVEAAARAWFGKPAKRLSLSEAVVLQACSRPAFYRPDRHPSGSWH